MAPKNNQRFAAIVRDAFTALGMTQAEFQTRGGPSDTTLRRIMEGHDVGVSPRTLLGLDVAFGWAPGSAAKALAGGDPPPATQTVRGVGITPPERHQAHVGLSVSPTLGFSARVSQPTPPSRTAHANAMIELSFLADDLDAAVGSIGLFGPVDFTDPNEVERYVDEVEDMGNAAEYPDPGGS